MNIAFHTGKTAMIAEAQALNIHGNNIANINTFGYQTIRPTFADCVYTRQRVSFEEEEAVTVDENGNETTTAYHPVLEEDWQTGHGAYIQKTDVMFNESSFYYTERPLDFAIAGEGFFAVQDRYGDINYTRDGTFGMTQADTGEWYLVSGSGEYVLDYDNNRIVVPFNEEGTVADYDELFGMVGVFEFENPYGLDAFGTNRYQSNGKSGVATANRNMEKIQGALITSNVELSDQMVALITTQRAYQISSRVVTTADEFARIANNLR